MSRNIVFVMILAMVFTSTMVGVNENDSEKELVDIEFLGVSIELGSQYKNSQDTIFFEYNGMDKMEYFTVDARIQAKPANIVLLLDKSLSMNTYDIENSYSPTSASRISVEKRISRQILESINSSSKIALILFGGDEIQEYGFDTNREILDDIISGIAPEGKDSCGGGGLKRAIDIAAENRRKTIIVVITDGLEIGDDCSRFIDVIGNAEKNEIVIYSVLLGREGNDLDMNGIAERTNGLFSPIDEERDIALFVRALTDSANGYYLEDLVLSLSTTGVRFKEAFLENEQLEMTEDFLYINSISYKEPVTLKIKFGVEGNEIDRNKSSFPIYLSITFGNSLQDSTEEISVFLTDVPFRCETKLEYIKRRIIEHMWKNKSWVIPLALVIIIVALYLIIGKLKVRKQKKELDYYIKKALHQEKKRNYKEALENWEEVINICKLKREKLIEELRKEYKEHISGANASKDLHDYEEAVEHLEKAKSFGNILEDKSVADLSAEYENMKMLIYQLDQEKNLTESLLDEIHQFLERIRKESERDLQEFEGYNILKEEMGPHLDMRHLRKKVSIIHEKKDLQKIKKMREKLEEVRNILLKILNKVT